MRRALAAIVLGVVLAMFSFTSVHAADCEFRLGFKALRDLIGHDIVGECLENEHYNAIGDSNQRTTGGLMAWRKADNWTAFTDGYRSWINGPNGLVQRLNTERFEWEADYAPGGIVTPTPTPRVIESELTFALEVMSLPPVGKTIRAWFDEVAPSLTYGTVSGGWTAFYNEPPRNEIVVRDVLRNERSEVQAAAIAWQTVIAVNSKRNGTKSDRWDSGEDCLEEVVSAERTMAQWWFERFGSGGLGDASTPWELWLNERAQHYKNNTIEADVRLHSGYREWCAQFGSLPPVPTPPPPPPRDCEFLGGFKEQVEKARVRFGEDYGECVENEQFHAWGSSQRTTNGILLFYAAGQVRINNVWTWRARSNWFVHGKVEVLANGCYRGAPHWDASKGERYRRYLEQQTVGDMYCPGIAGLPDPQPQVIDRKFNAALRALRRTGTLGQFWYDKVFALETSIVLDDEGECSNDLTEKPAGCAGGWENTIYIVSSFYEKWIATPDVLAALLVHEIAHIVWYVERGPDESTAECFTNEANSEEHEVLWLVERYGKSRALRLDNVKAYYNGTLLAWVKSRPLWQESCGRLERD